MNSCPAGASIQARRRFARAAGLSVLLLTAALTGCVVAPLPPPAYPVTVEAAPGPVVIASQPPPPPIVEPVVVAPAPGYIWIGGYWSWSDGRHVWTRGHWAAPRAGYRWVPRTWSQGPGGRWHQHGGHWQR